MKSFQFFIKKHKFVNTCWKYAVHIWFLFIIPRKYQLSKFKNLGSIWIMIRFAYELNKQNIIATSITSLYWRNLVVELNYYKLKTYFFIFKRWRSKIFTPLTVYLSAIISWIFLTLSVSILFNLFSSIFGATLINSWCQFLCGWILETVSSLITGILCSDPFSLSSQLFSYFL